MCLIQLHHIHFVFFLVYIRRFELQLHLLYWQQIRLTEIDNHKTLFCNVLSTQILSRDKVWQCWDHSSAQKANYQSRIVRKRYSSSIGSWRWGLCALRWWRCLEREKRRHNYSNVLLWSPPLKQLRVSNYAQEQYLKLIRIFMVFLHHHFRDLSSSMTCIEFGRIMGNWILRAKSDQDLLYSCVCLREGT